MLGVWHFSFTASDLDGAVGVYTRLLRFELVHVQERHNDHTRAMVGYPGADLRVAQLAVPGQPRGLSTRDLELVQCLSPTGDRCDHDIYNPGQAYLAATVEDVDAEYARLLASGVEFLYPRQRITSCVNEGAAIMYMYGFDHLVHELVQPPAHRLAEHRRLVGAR